MKSNVHVCTDTLVGVGKMLQATPVDVCRKIYKCYLITISLGGLVIINGCHVGASDNINMKMVR